MKLQIMSDLHLEFHRDGGESFIQSLPVAADTLIVAGDLTTLDNLFEAFYLLGRKWKTVLYVPGNHELYDGSSLQDMKDVFEDYRENGRYKDRIHILYNDVVKLGKQRFLGTTLWFQDTPESRLYTNLISDFSAIRKPHELFEENEKALNFLNDNLERGDVVITHHIPHLLGVADVFRTEAVNVYFYCPLEDLIIDRQPKLWIFGHTHTAFDFKQGNTRLIANPFGYPHEATDFIENMVVNV